MSVGGKKNSAWMEILDFFLVQYVFVVDTAFMWLVLQVFSACDLLSYTYPHVHLGHTHTTLYLISVDRIEVTSTEALRAWILAGAYGKRPAFGPLSQLPQAR